MRKGFKEAVESLQEKIEKIENLFRVIQNTNVGSVNKVLRSKGYDVSLGNNVEAKYKTYIMLNNEKTKLQEKLKRIKFKTLDEYYFLVEKKVIEQNLDFDKEKSLSRDGVFQLGFN